MQLENSNKAIHCGLCLNIISYRNSEILKIVREVFEIVLPNLILEKKNEHRMCKPCWSKLFAAYIFKVTCMDIENIILSHVSSDKESAIELKEVYLKVNGNIELTDMWEKQRICRLCLQLVTFDFVSFDEVDNDIIDTYIAHVKIDATKNPVICVSCFNSLRTHGGFLINCLKAHDKFKSADKQPDIKCEIKLEDGPDVDEQFYIKSEEIEIKMEGDQDQDTSSYKLGEKIIENKRNHISEHVQETKYASVFTCETKDQLNKNSSEIQMYMCNNYESNHKDELKLYQLTHKDPSEQKNHQLLHKNPSEMYKCESCTYETKYKRNLQNHQLMHKDSFEIKMYKCEFCTYETKWKQYLKIHQLIHKNSSEVQLYKCDECDYETKHKYALKGHQLLHKNPAEIQMYKCEFCTYKSKRKGNLRSHQLKHKNSSEIQMFRCDTCDYKSKYESVLKNHQLLHKDPREIRIYKCDFCTYETKYKRSLKTHQFTHKDPSEMKMYKCTICIFETNYKRCLKRHILLHKGCSEIQM